MTFHKYNKVKYRFYKSATKIHHKILKNKIFLQNSSKKFQISKHHFISIKVNNNNVIQHQHKLPHKSF